MTKPQLPPGVIPIGATHFHHNPVIETPTSNPWRKRSGAGWMAFYDGEWRGCNGSKAHLFVAIEDVLGKSSGGWDGEGLPPVGTVCEYRSEGWPRDQWEVRTVMYTSEYHVITKEEDGTERRVDGKKAQFRPIRTSEQIAAEERTRGIQEIRDLFASGRGTDYATFIYDAGYRRITE